MTLDLDEYSFPAGGSQTELRVAYSIEIYNKKNEKIV
jgi:hypothetical protein